MEVGGISQGRQSNLDSIQTNKNNNDLQNRKENCSMEIDSNLQDKDFSKKDIESLKKSVDRLNGFMRNDDTKVVYEVHDKFKKDVMIKVVNNITGEVISEIPPKKILDLVAEMCEMVGVVFDKKA